MDFEKSRYNCKIPYIYQTSGDFFFAKSVRERNYWILLEIFTFRAPKNIGLLTWPYFPFLYVRSVSPIFIYSPSRPFSSSLICPSNLTGCVESEEKKGDVSNTKKKRRRNSCIKRFIFLRKFATSDLFSAAAHFVCQAFQFIFHLFRRQNTYRNLFSLKGRRRVREEDEKTGCPTAKKKQMEVYCCRLNASPNRKVPPYITHSDIQISTFSK